MTERRHVHLVGSMNLPSAEQAMGLAADRLGDALLRLPDGEPGPRRGWIFYQRPMFTHNRHLEPVDPTPGVAGIVSNRTVRRGVDPDEIDFPELGYAREAQTSYRWFRRARDEGRVAPGTRFQVSLPTPYGVLTSAVDPGAIDLVEPAYEAAMLTEVATICDTIPHDDLALQWDVCIEMILFDGRMAQRGGWDDAAHRARFRRLTGAVPSDVHLGIHLCYGDYDGRHMIEPTDGAKLAGLADIVGDESPRPLQFLHVPVPVERDDEGYFEPFSDLSLGAETELFLGLVHHTDGVEGGRRRMQAAERFVAGFGVATECGIGRVHTTGEIVEILDVHAALSGR